MIKSKYKLIKLVTTFRFDILKNKSSENMCYHVCEPLVKFLNKKGYNCELIFGILEFDGLEYEHFWILLSNGNIIDPTADQFNDYGESLMPPVYIGKKPLWYKED